MFSIARHDESEQDERSYEKRLDRLSKLNERVSRKRKQATEPEPEDDHSEPLEAEEQGTEVDQAIAETSPIPEPSLVEEYEPKKAKRNKPKKKKAKQDTEIVKITTDIISESIEIDDLQPVEPQEEPEEEPPAVDDSEVIEEESMLQAFPDFTPSEPDVKDVAQLKSMGVPYWLAHPTVIDQGATTPLSSIPGLSDKLLDRCREQGIEEFFAGTLR
jgi:hypothetical protein